MEEKKIQESKDRQARKYNITLNNPLSMVPPMTHPQIKEEIGKLSSVSYWCMGAERADTTYTHLFVQCFAYPLLYGKKAFSTGTHRISLWFISRKQRLYSESREMEKYL